MFLWVPPVRDFHPVQEFALHCAFDVTLAALNVSSALVPTCVLCASVPFSTRRLPLLSHFSSTRASLANVYFPSVTVCNINQARKSLLRQFGVDGNDTLLLAVLQQAYFGAEDDLPADKLEAVARLFAASEVIREGLLADAMLKSTSLRSEAEKIIRGMDMDAEVDTLAAEEYVAEAAWYFKTLAVQEVGEMFCCTHWYSHLLLMVLFLATGLLQHNTKLAIVCLGTSLRQRIN